MMQAGLRSLREVRTWVALLVLWLGMWWTAWAAPVAQTANPYPALRGDIYAQDFVGVLSAGTVQRLDRLGAALEAKSGAQVVVAVMPSAPNEDIATYATDLYRHWQIGDKEKNNGVLLLVIPDANQVRVEVGYGLEGALNDAKVGALLDRYFVPAAREGNLELACRQMYEALLVQTMKEYGLTADDLAAPSQPAPAEWNWMTVVWAILILVVMGLDLVFNGGRLTQLVIYILLHSRGGGGGGFRGGGGGSSGGGGAGRSW